MLHTHAIGIDGIATSICKDMTVLSHCDEVVSDGHADGEFALFVGSNHLAILGTDSSIDVEICSLHGIVRSGIEHLTADGERGDILEVHTAVVQRRHADETRPHAGRELMDAQCRDDAVAGAFAREAHAADGIGTIHIGVAHQAQLVLVGHNCGTFGRRLVGLGVTSIGDAVALREVIGKSLLRQALVEGIIDEQALLVAHDGVVVVLLDVFFCEGFCPETELVEIAVEVCSAVEIRVVADGQALSLVGDYGDIPDGFLVVVRNDSSSQDLALSLVVLHHEDGSRHAVCIMHQADVRPGIRSNEKLGVVFVVAQRHAHPVLPDGLVVAEVDAEGVIDVHQLVATLIGMHRDAVGIHIRLDRETASDHGFQCRWVAVVLEAGSITREVYRPQGAGRIAVAVLRLQCYLGTLDGSSSTIGDVATDDTRRQAEAVGGLAVIVRALAILHRPDDKFVIIEAAWQSRHIVVTVCRASAGSGVDIGPVALVVTVQGTALYGEIRVIVSHLLHGPLQFHNVAVGTSRGHERLNLRTAQFCRPYITEMVCSEDIRHQSVVIRLIGSQVIVRVKVGTLVDIRVFHVNILHVDPCG